MIKRFLTSGISDNSNNKNLNDIYIFTHRYIYIYINRYLCYYIRCGYSDFCSSYLFIRPDALLPPSSPPRSAPQPPLALKLHSIMQLNLLRNLPAPLLSKPFIFSQFFIALSFKPSKNKKKKKKKKQNKKKKKNQHKTTAHNKQFRLFYNFY